MTNASHLPARRAPILALLTLVTGGAALLTLLWLERDYYLKPLADQAVDPRHPILRSSGTLGLALGLLAGALMVVNLLYVVRRRFLQVQGFGSLRAWMNLHVVSGLLAAGFVVAHSTLHVRSAPAAVASLALAVVILTGLVGRYLHAQIPRTREGRELSLDEARRRFEELRAELAELGLPPLPAAPTGSDRRGSKLRSLARVLFGDPAARERHRRYRARLRELRPDRAARRRIEPTLARMLGEAQALTRLSELSALMASWRFLHRWLALVMVGTAACHVWIALRFGAIDFGKFLP